ncbi:MAG: NAD(P)/FAD-dependent oxidoreductase [Actinomycetota bacterium]
MAGHDGNQMRPSVVIVGGGFGGLEAAKHLATVDVDITLIDRHNHHLFQPLLYQVATAGLNPADIAHPIRSILRSQDNVEVVLEEVVDIDPTDRVVHLRNHRLVRFDYLVLAAGARHAYFGNDEWEQFAPGLKSIEDAIEIRRRVLGAFELAEQATTPEVRHAAMTFVVVGAGPSGVELAGAVAEIARHTLARDFHHIDTTETRVLLVEGGPRVLPAFDTSLSEHARTELEGLGVTVMTDTMVVDIDAHGVEIAVEDTSSRVDTFTVLWAAGVAASPLGAMLAAKVGVEVDRSGRIPVDDALAVDNIDGVFAIGDMAAVVSDNKPVPGVAPAAIQGARHVAKAIEADLASQPRPAFRYLDKGSLATIGRSAAVAEFGPIKFSGFFAWVLWWAVHILLLIGFRSRALVMFSWGWSWLTFRRGARLITSRWRPGAGLDPPPGPKGASRHRSV